MSPSFLLISLVWTALLALGAEGLARGRVNPVYAQRVWRMSAILMVLPWLGLLIAPLLPAAPIYLPDFPDLVDFGAEQTVPSGVASTSGATPSDTLNASRLLLGVLILGWLIRAGFALAAQFRLRTLKQAARQADTGRLAAISAHWAARLRLKKTPQIARFRGPGSPFVSGLFSQTIYLPASLTDETHLGPVLAHECTHIARGDLITRPLERMVADLIWFSPFAWLARHRLDYWREAVCDAETVRLTAEPIAYARALSFVARTARPLPSLPIAALILNKRKTLPMRVSSILEPTLKTSRKRLSIGLAALFVAVPLALAQSVGEASNKTQTFSAPILASPDARITSRYGIRKDPFTRTETWHAGIDIAGPKGTDIALPIYAPAGGDIIFSGWKSGYGNIVEIKLEPSGNVLRFGQLESLSVTLGDTVNAGAEVGLMGSSGRSTGRHLHFEYLKPGPSSEQPAEGHSDTDLMRPHNPEEIEGLVLVPAE